MFAKISTENKHLQSEFQTYSKMADHRNHFFLLVNTEKWLCAWDVNTERACAAELLFLSYLGTVLQAICHLMKFQVAEVKHQVQYKQIIYYINK